MKKLIVFLLFAGPVFVLLFSANSNASSGTIIAPDSVYDWYGSSYGFMIHNYNTSQYFRVYYAFEFAGAFYWVKDKGFTISEGKAEYDTIWVEQDEEKTVYVAEFDWPYQCVPLYTHFWLWFEAQCSVGSNIDLMAKGVTYRGGYATPPHPTSTPWPTSTPDPSYSIELTADPESIPMGGRSSKITVHLQKNGVDVQSDIISLKSTNGLVTALSIISDGYGLATLETTGGHIGYALVTGIVHGVSDYVVVEFTP
jgi:hypothetical protein